MRVINEIGEDIYEISRNKRWKMRVRLKYSEVGGCDDCEIRNYCTGENICVILGITNPNQVFKRDDKVD